MGTAPLTKAQRTTLDVSVRNAISNLYKDPTTGVKKFSYGYYKWEPSGEGEVKPQA